MIVYLDILFLVNFLMNYFVISICTAIVPNGSKYKRKILASILGGIYGVGMFVPNLDFLYSVMALIIFSGGLCAIIFCPCKISDFFRIFAVFYLSNFILSGGIYMLLPFFGGGILRNNIIYIKSGYLIFFAVIIGVAVICGIKYAKKNLGKREYVVKIRYKEHCVEGLGMLDTGNKLKDPITGEGVIVIGNKILEKLFFEGCSEFNLSECIDNKDFRLIPYKTVANEGVMMGFVADEVIFAGKDLKKVTVAVSPEDLKDMVLVNCENF